MPSKIIVVIGLLLAMLPVLGETSFAQPEPPFHVQRIYIDKTQTPRDGLDELRQVLNSETGKTVVTGIAVLFGADPDDAHQAADLIGKALAELHKNENGEETIYTFDIPRGYKFCNMLQYGVVSNVPAEGDPRAPKMSAIAGPSDGGDAVGVYTWVPKSRIYENNRTWLEMYIDVVTVQELQYDQLLNQKICIPHGQNFLVGQAPHLQATFPTMTSISAAAGIGVTKSSTIDIKYFDHAWSPGVTGQHNKYSWPHYEFFVDFVWRPEDGHDAGVALSSSRDAIVNCRIPGLNNLDIADPKDRGRWRARIHPGDEVRFWCAVLDTTADANVVLHIGDNGETKSRITIYSQKRNQAAPMGAPVAQSHTDNVRVTAFDYSWSEGGSRDLMIGHPNGYDFPHYDFFMDFEWRPLPGYERQSTSVEVEFDPASNVNCYGPPDRIREGDRIRMECQVVKSVENTDLKIHFGDGSSIDVNFPLKTSP